MSAMDAAATMDSNASDGHPLVIFLSAFFWVVRECIFAVLCRSTTDTLALHPCIGAHRRRSVWLLSLVKSLIAFSTISVPRFIYAVLSYSMTLTVRVSVCPPERPRLTCTLPQRFV